MDASEFTRGLGWGEGRKKAILGSEDCMWKYTAFGNFGFVLFTKPGLGLVPGFSLPSNQYANRRAREDKARKVVRGSLPG